MRSDENRPYKRVAIESVQTSVIQHCPVMGLWGECSMCASCLLRGSNFPPELLGTIRGIKQPSPVQPLADTEISGYNCLLTMLAGISQVPRPPLTADKINLLFSCGESSALCSFTAERGEGVPA